MDVRYTKNTEFIYRNVAGEALLLPVSQKAGEIRSSIYTLNETAGRAWELMDGERTLAEVCSLMVAEFDADSEQIRQDLLELVEQLGEIGALQCAGNLAGEG